MNAPTIWIVVPAIIAVLLAPINNQRILSLVGGFLAVLLAVASQFVPIEQAMKVGAFSLKIDSSLNILGRVLLIKPEEGPLLALIYGATALWFFGAEASRSSLRLVPIWVSRYCIDGCLYCSRTVSLRCVVHRNGGRVIYKRLNTILPILTDKYNLRAIERLAHDINHQSLDGY